MQSFVPAVDEGSGAGCCLHDKTQVPYEILLDSKAYEPAVHDPSVQLCWSYHHRWTRIAMPYTEPWNPFDTSDKICFPDLQDALTVSPVLQDDAADAVVDIAVLATCHPVEIDGLRSPNHGLLSPELSIELEARCQAWFDEQRRIKAARVRQQCEPGGFRPHLMNDCQQPMWDSAKGAARGLVFLHYLTSLDCCTVWSNNACPACLTCRATPQPRVAASSCQGYLTLIKAVY